MKEAIPVNLVEGWIAELQSILKQESQDAEAKTDLRVNLGMSHALDRIQNRLTTWLRHQKYLHTLSRLGRKFLVVRRVNLSDGNFRKLEWYENDRFIVLAWRHAKDAETGELVLELQHAQDLSRTYLTYRGGLSFDDLAALARKGGLEAVKNEGNQKEWMEKT